VEAVGPQRGERIIDPACGAGSFLSYSARYLKGQGVKDHEIDANLFGIEKDEYLAKLAKLHIALGTLGAGNVFCGDSIEGRPKDGGAFPFEMEESFDVVLANPPFGAKIKVGSAEARDRFHLAHRWVKDKKLDSYKITDALLSNPTPQILFLELCVKLLRPGGRMGVVVPESMISSASSGYVVQYLMSQVEINAVVGMPESLFKTSGKGGTHTKTCLVVATKRSEKSREKAAIFMAEAKWCGHDSRGNVVPRNDLPKVLSNFRERKADDGEKRLGYLVEPVKVRDLVLAPRYYNPEAIQILGALSRTHELITIGEMVAQGAVEIATGDEIGKLAYGTGDIPFVRTSDISNWEIKLDPKHGVSEEIYARYAARQDVREGDILMVRDGTYLIGTCAYVSKYDTRIVYQSHLYKIRVRHQELMSPFLMLAALSSKPVVAQIQAKRFTQDIIDSLGRRVHELVIPVPRDVVRRKEIEAMVEKSIVERIESRELARRAKEEIAKVE
jgi:type I restriction enzyme M protein